MHVNQIARWALVAVSLTGLVGCARVSDNAATSTGATSAAATGQLVTAAYGTQVLAGGPIRAGISAMDALRATTAVETAYGGGFVNGMHGKRATTAPRQDWMYTVNGVAPGVGAAEYTVREGDRIWWDYRRWGDGPASQVAVGSWPEPFVHGYPTPPAAVQADPPLAGALTSAGATVSAAASSYRVIVGANRDLVRRDPAWRRAVGDPDRAGLVVRIGAGGVQRLDRDGQQMTAVPSGRAIAVAVLSGASPEDGGVVLAVAGVDAPAARAAAAAIASDPRILAGHVALVFDGRGQVVASAGRATR